MDEVVRGELVDVLLHRLLAVGEVDPSVPGSISATSALAWPAA